VRYVPDFGQAPPPINKSEARRRLGLPAQARIVACVGGLNERKNLTALFEALSHPACPSDICAMLVGPAAPELDASLRNGLPNVLLQQGRLFLFKGTYDAERLGAALSAADCAWLCYRRHLGSSGFLWEAAQAGLPIVGCPAGEIAHQVESLKLGLTILDEHPASTARALDRATRHSEEAEHWRRNCLLAGISHTRAAFGHAVCQVIDESREST
jgi:glycosyltransferase involved in cell wall biosynthesis